MGEWEHPTNDAATPAATAILDNLESDMKAPRELFFDEPYMQRRPPYARKIPIRSLKCNKSFRCNHYRAILNPLSQVRNPDFIGCVRCSHHRTLADTPRVLL
jgi:hypothetical protein